MVVAGSMATTIHYNNVYDISAIRLFNKLN